MLSTDRALISQYLAYIISGNGSCKYLTPVPASRAREDGVLIVRSGSGRGTVPEEDWEWHKNVALLIIKQERWLMATQKNVLGSFSS